MSPILTPEIAQCQSKPAQKFKDRLLEFVDARDWEASVFAQNVILECLEFTVFRHHAGTADPVTQRCCGTLSQTSVATWVLVRTIWAEPDCGPAHT